MLQFALYLYYPFYAQKIKINYYFATISLRFKYSTSEYLKPVKTLKHKNVTGYADKLIKIFGVDSESKEYDDLEKDSPEDDFLRT